MTTFIYKKEGVLGKGICKKFIETFEEDTDKHGRGMVGGADGTQEKPEIKSSTDISFTPEDENDPKWGHLLSEIVTIVTHGISEYEREYWLGMDHIENVIMLNSFNMQRFEPGEGYKAFHCERGSMQFPNRTHAWMIYLNDVDNGGQTEFPYQHIFEIPRVGKLLIWPSDFTHTHRGIISPTQTKYILTGWIGWPDFGPWVHKDFMNLPEGHYVNPKRRVTVENEKKHSMKLSTEF